VRAQEEAKKKKEAVESTSWASIKSMGKKFLPTAPSDNMEDAANAVRDITVFDIIIR
jgi:hypothetical protein